MNVSNNLSILKTTRYNHDLLSIATQYLNEQNNMTFSTLQRKALEYFLMKNGDTQNG